MCGRSVPIKLEGKFYKISMRPIMLYCIECWAMKKQHIYKISVAELRMLIWINGNIRKDSKIGNPLKDKSGPY